MRMTKLEALIAARRLIEQSLAGRQASRAVVHAVFAAMPTEDELIAVASLAGSGLAQEPVWQRMERYHHDSMDRDTD